jgi:hypothetical protein
MQIRHLCKAMVAEYRLMFAFKLDDLLACFVIFESWSARGPGVLTIKMGKEPLLSLPEKTLLGGSGVSKLNHEARLRHIELSCSSPFFFKNNEKKMSTKDHSGTCVQVQGDAAARIAGGEPEAEVGAAGAAGAAGAPGVEVPPAPSVTSFDCRGALSTAVAIALPCKFRTSMPNGASMSARQLLWKPRMDIGA